MSGQAGGMDGGLPGRSDTDPQACLMSWRLQAWGSGSARALLSERLWESKKDPQQPAGRKPRHGQTVRVTPPVQAEFSKSSSIISVIHSPSGLLSLFGILCIYRFILPSQSALWITCFSSNPSYLLSFSSESVSSPFMILFVVIVVT